MQDELGDLRNKVSRALILLLWGHVPLVAVIAILAGNPWMLPVCLAAVFAGTATAAWFRRPAGLNTRLIISIAFVAMVSVVLGACTGSAWQGDVHMYYFAALAITAAYCDPLVILTGAGCVAIHHLGLNFLAPALVFPGDSNLARVLVHAVILVMEAGALVWMSHRVLTLVSVKADLTASIAAAEKARALEAEVAHQRERAEQDRLANEAARAVGLRQQQEVVSSLASGLTGLAEGDLTSRLGDMFAMQYEPLRLDFNATAESLQGALRAIATTSEGIESRSDEIAHASDDVARRTEQQAANLVETSSALNTITDSLQMTATGTVEAAQLITTTRGDAESSGAIVEQTVDAMGKIKDSSSQISNIIGVIDEIAFQTNLLALNAGVEAARAGDAGRGFAVVASEVRALAQRSAEAAKEIKALISNSTVQVETGVVLVGKTGASLREIIAKIAAVDGLIGQISSASRTQATSLAEINMAVRQMDQAVQQNAGVAEASNSAASALIKDAENLSRLVGRFKIGGMSTPPKGANVARGNPVHAAQARVAAAVRR